MDKEQQLDIIKKTIKDIEKELKIDIRSIENTIFKKIYAPKTHEFIVLIKKDRFRIELPIVKYLYLKQPNPDDEIKLVGNEAYKLLFSERKLKIKPLFLLEKCNLHIHSPYYNLDELSNNEEYIKANIITELLKEFDFFIINNA